MRFSLVMATLNRCTEVAKFLTYLSQQTFRDFELIIVDQNQDGKLDDIISKHEKLNNIKHYKVNFTGISRARNFGLKYANGEIISFPDDDCWYVQQDLLEQINKRMLSGKDIDGLSCLVKLHKSMKWLAKTVHINKKNIFYTIIEYNFFIKKSAINKIGIFNENLGLGGGSIYGSGEGTDFILRALVTGSKLLYSPEIYMYHDDKLDNFSKNMQNRGFLYGCGLGYVLYKHNFSLLYKFRALIRPFMAFILYLHNMDKSLYYWNIFKGRLKGLLSAKTANI